MSQKIVKALRRHANAHELPKSYFRKLLKLRKEHKLNLTDSLYLIDTAASMYYKAMNQISDGLEEQQKELENDKED